MNSYPIRWRRMESKMRNWPSLHNHTENILYSTLYTIKLKICTQRFYCSSSKFSKFIRGNSPLLQQLASVSLPKEKSKICPKLTELLLSSWNGPTVHVCCFILARTSTKAFVISCVADVKYTRKKVNTLLQLPVTLWSMKPRPSHLHTYLLTYLLIYSMVQSPSWEANWFAASQEIPPISRNPNVHYRTHKRPLPVSILGQPNPVHIPTFHLLEIDPNIIHPSTPRSPQWSTSLRFPHQDPIL